MPKSEALVAELSRNHITVRKEVPLSKFTTFGIGGNARLLVVVEDSVKLETAAKLAFAFKMPYRVIGCGSNLLISDDGYDGLIIVNRSKSWQIIDDSPIDPQYSKITSRYDPLEMAPQSKQYQSENLPRKIVRVDSGFNNNALIEEMFRQGLTGLEWFSGIPSSVGGAVYMNMHGAHAYFGNLVYRAKLIDGTTTKIVDNAYFQFDYDYSILQKTKEVVLWVELLLTMGNVEEAIIIAKDWKSKKSHQPRHSAGCIFKNLSPEVQKRYNLPTSSVGYLIDKVLNLKGLRVGGAIISTRHAAFIENDGNASAKDVYELIEIIKTKAKETLGLELETEVELLGNFQ
ncbi:MAG TPA: FAD-binding protein [Candidatus Marinimicrobia bacterium]|nr:FAD-binding protein [Candidatus Neomarinimicrobiota bacterium]HRS51599.1 FAD-binding protein [Candidatus Neomarinimicrobiota bacterium]HRU92323.1 FAD-binding protein [Candidatus Neomarinimicrobiota bacterium]